MLLSVLFFQSTICLYPSHLPPTIAPSADHTPARPPLFPLPPHGRATVFLLQNRSARPPRGGCGPAAASPPARSPASLCAGHLPWIARAASTAHRVRRCTTPIVAPCLVLCWRCVGVASFVSYYFCFPHFGGLSSSMLCDSLLNFLFGLSLFVVKIADLLLASR